MIRLKGALSISGTFSKLMQLTFATLFFAIVGLLAWKLSSGSSSGINSMKLLQLTESIGVFLLPPLFLAFLWSVKPSEYLHINKIASPYSNILIIFFMLIIIPSINLISSLNQQLTLPQALAPVENWMKATEESTARLTADILNVHTLPSLLFNILLVAIIPAIAEELFFRGIIQRIITEWKGAKTGIWLGAIIFSLFHMQFYGFIPRMLLGAFFGYLLVWSGSLWLPVLAHFINNVTAVIFYYLKNNGVNVFDIDTIGTESTLWVGFLSAIAGVGIIIIIHNSTKRIIP